MMSAATVTAVLLSAAASAPASDKATGDSPSLQQENVRLRKALADAEAARQQAQEALDNARKRAVEAYEKAYREYLAAERAYGAAAPDRAAALKELKESSERFVDSALAAYVRANRTLRTTIRKQLFVTTAYGQDWKSFLDALQARLRGGGEDPVALTQVFQSTTEMLGLARVMSRPENQQRVQRILDEADRMYPDPTHQAAGAAGARRSNSYDFAASFDLLRGLNEKALRHVSGRLKREMGRFDPEVRMVRDRLVVVYIVHGKPSASYVDGFQAVFGSWMREASPDQQSREFTFSGSEWDAKKVDELMDRAKLILTEQDVSTLAPPCPAQTSTVADQFNAVLCPPSYAGVIAVELTPGAPDGRDVVASWRVREQGTELNAQTRFATRSIAIPATDPVAGHSLRPEGELAGDDFALAVFSKATIYKRISGLFQRMLRADPKTLARYRDLSAAKASDEPVTSPVAPDAPPPSTSKAPVLTPSTASASSPAAVLSARSPPPEAGGVPWHAVAFAGAPYLEDRQATATSAGVISVLDLAAVSASLTFFGLSIDRRNAYSSGDRGALDDANQLRTAGVAATIGLFAFRGAVALCYWNEACRNWSRAW